MEQKTMYKTHGKIMHRVAKTNINVHGVRRVTHIPTNKPCILIFGGERTTKNKFANYYASMLERLINFYKLSGINIYSAIYDFESTYRDNERINAFVAARSKILNQGAKIQPVDTQYVNDLYNIIIRPRLVNKNGMKLRDAVALKNIRNVIIYTHCHGATPVRTFQNIMAADMKKLGYAPRTIRNIMKNVLVIQHAPVSPLEKSLFNTISFMSANDTRMYFFNKFSDYVSENDGDLAASYFSLGNCFVLNGFTYQYIDEHQITGLVPNENQDMLTPDGAIIMAAERNAIINGLRASQNGTPMPNIRELIAPVSPDDTVKPNFDVLSQNGEAFMNLMRHDLRKTKAKER